MLGMKVVYYAQVTVMTLVLLVDIPSRHAVAAIEEETIIACKKTSNLPDLDLPPICRRTPCLDNSKTVNQDLSSQHLVLPGENTNPSTATVSLTDVFNETIMVDEIVLTLSDEVKNISVTLHANDTTNSYTCDRSDVIVDPARFRQDGGALAGAGVHSCLLLCTPVYHAVHSCVLQPDVYAAADNITVHVQPTDSRHETDISLTILAVYGKSSSKDGDSTCYKYGTSSCTAAGCQCLPGIEEHNTGLCTPNISTIKPHSGPVSGNTMITIYGQGFLHGGIPEVKIADVPCVVINIAMDQLVCVSGPAPDLQPASHVIRVRFGGYDMTTDDVTFTYKPQPDILTVSRDRTSVLGGLLVTLTGSHLDSYQDPNVEMLYYFKHKTLGEDPVVGLVMESCDSTTSSSSQLTCRTPNVADVVQQLAQANSYFSLAGGFDGTLNDNQYFTFIFNFFLSVRGHYGTINGSTSMVPIDMYTTPQLDTQTDEVVYRPYWPHNDNDITITNGRYIDGCCTPDDYIVSFNSDGIEQQTADCQVEALNYNAIHCRPRKKGFGVTSLIVRAGNYYENVAHIRYQLWHEDQTIIAAVAVAAVVVVVLAAVVVVYVVYRRRRATAKHVEGTAAMERNMVYHEYPCMQLLDLVSSDREYKEIVQENRIDNVVIDRTKVLGSGCYGAVYRGTYNNEPVAVKVMKYQGDLTAVREFLNEGLIMAKFQHNNVLNLVGIYLTNDPHIVMPYMDKGDLKSYVAKRPPELNASLMLRLCIQCCTGMTYLANQKFVHRDLAARNCLINKAMQLKVCDFGYTRDMYESDYYKILKEKKDRKFPYKWMALESIKDQRYDSKTDVWSFGVVMWEVYSYGAKPYQDIPNNMLKMYLEQGGRLEKPQSAPQQIYDVMYQCWTEDVDSRPEFMDVLTQLEDLETCREAQGQGQAEGDGYLIPLDRMDSYLESTS